MTKYQMAVNQEWDYDELEKEEFLLFQTPDDFVFDANILLEFYTSLGKICEIYKLQGNYVYGITVYKDEKKIKKQSVNITIHHLLDADRNKERSEFINWLKNNKEVYLLEYNLIE